MTENILELMTPVEILEKRDNFEKAWPILPERFPTFDHLLEWREKIRDLVLLPVKSDEMRAYYKTLDKNELAREVWEMLGKERFRFAGNKFPYLVPENTQQYILWIKDPLETREEVAEYIKQVVQVMNFNLDEVILFERPVGITTQLVRGTFPLIRHVHLWTRQS